MSSRLMGEIRLFASDYAPAGWALCKGQVMDNRQYPALGVVLGGRFGTLGPNAFKVPNLSPLKVAVAGQPPLQYAISLDGDFPVEDRDPESDQQALLGQIRLFAGNFAPGGWKFCDGSSVVAHPYDDLGQVIDTQFGGNPSQGKCNLPKLAPLKVADGTATISYIINVAGYYLPA